VGGLQWQRLPAAALALTCTCVVHAWLQRAGYGWPAASCVSASLWGRGLMAGDCCCCSSLASVCCAVCLSNTTEQLIKSNVQIHPAFALSGILAGFAAVHPGSLCCTFGQCDRNLQQTRTQLNSYITTITSGVLEWTLLPHRECYCSDPRSNRVRAVCSLLNSQQLQFCHLNSQLAVTSSGSTRCATTTA
jgi:hypothetical protein